MDNAINNYGFYIIIGEFVIIVFLLLWHFLFSEDDSDKIYSLEKKIAGKQKQLNEAIKACDDLQHQLQSYRNSFEQNKNVVLKTENMPLKEELEPVEKNCTNNPHKFAYQYLQEANAGKFLKLYVTPEKCYFRTWEEDGVRKYEFCGNESKALANINAVFDDVCNIEGKQNGASRIDNITPGTLDSELRITSKAKIRLV